MRGRRRRVIAACATGALCLTVGCKDGTGNEEPDSGLVNSYFESDAEGWTLVGDYENPGGIPYYLAEGGNPGGYIAVQDAERSEAWFFVAPAKFRGDFAEAYGRWLRFDLQQSDLVNQDLTTPFVVLEGAGLRMELLPPRSPGLSWTRFRIKVAEGEGWKNAATGAPATADELRTVLGDLDLLQIRGEFIRGADNGAIDNVVLGGRR